MSKVLPIFDRNLQRLLQTVKWASHAPKITQFQRDFLSDFYEALKAVEFSHGQLSGLESELWSTREAAVKTGLHPDAITNFVHRKKILPLASARAMALYDPASLAEAKPRTKRTGTKIRRTPRR